MSADISTILTDTISSTLETNLSQNVVLEDTFTVDKPITKYPTILSNKLSLSFETITLNLKFIFTSDLAAHIFAVMMMEDEENPNEINDDTIDTIKEIIAQVSGGLETAINAAELEGLGKTTKSVEEIQPITTNDYTKNEDDKLIQLKFNINDKIYFIYIEISKVALDFFETLSNSEILTTDDEENNDDVEIDGLTTDDEENNDEEDETFNQNNIETREDTPPEIEDKNTEDSNENNSSENDTEDKEKETNKTKKDSTSQDDKSATEEEENENKDEKKNKRLKMLVFIVAGLLVSILIGFTTAYFMGVFDPPPQQPQKTHKKKKKTPQSMIIANIKNKQIDFKINMINTKRLNRRLSLLTKYEILEDDALEKFKREEKERLYKLKMKKLEEFASNNKEEALFQKNKILKYNIKQKNRFLENNKTNSAQKAQILYENQELIFIQISSLKYKKYKDIIDEEKPMDIKTSICQNTNGKIDVYIGPIYLKLITNNIINRIKQSNGSKNDAKIVILTKKEFDQRCNF